MWNLEANLRCLPAAGYLVPDTASPTYLELAEKHRLASETPPPPTSQSWDYQYTTMSGVCGYENQA